MASKNILIIGATGVIGKYITKEIVDSNKFEKVAVFTSQNTADTKTEELDALKAKGVKVIVGDVRNEQDIKAAYEGKMELSRRRTKQRS